MNDRLRTQLFEVEGKELVNIKFCVGHGEDISEADFRDAVATKVFEIDNKLTHAEESFGDRGQNTTAVKDILARLKQPSN